MHYTLTQTQDYKLYFLRQNKIFCLCKRRECHRPVIENRPRKFVWSLSDNDTRFLMMCRRRKLGERVYRVDIFGMGYW